MAAKQCLQISILIVLCATVRNMQAVQQEGQKLVETQVNVEDPSCANHGNEKYFYSVDDESLASPMCETEHQDYDVVPEEVTVAKLKGILAAKYPPLVESIKQVRSQMQQMEQEVKNAQVSRTYGEEMLERKRREMYRAVDENVNQMKSWLRENQRVKLSHFEHQRKNLQQEMEYLIEEESSLKASLGEFEAISFLKGYKDLLHRLESRSRFTTVEPAPSILLDLVMQQNVDLLIQLNENLMKEIKKELVKQEKIADLEFITLKSLYGRTPRLDPNSAHPWIVISHDFRMVTLTETVQPYPEHRDRFDGFLQVVSSESFSSGRHYWEVDVSSSRSYDIGICLNSMGRKGKGNESLLGMNPKSWTLMKHENIYSTWHNNQGALLSVSGNPERFGFLLDFEEGELTCFGDSRVLHVFKGNFTKPVKPAIGVYDDYGSVRFCSL